MLPKSLMRTLNMKNWNPECWTPAYIANRLKAAHFFRRKGETPWLVKDTVLFLDSYLTKEDKVLEYGSGKSTLYFASKCQDVVSVEHNEEWHGHVSKQLTEKSINNVTYLFHDDDNYISCASDYADASFSVILVDGWRRNEAALASLNKLKSGGIFIIDNANMYIPCDSKAPNTISKFDLSTEEGKQWSDFCSKTESWRKYWSGNGVTHTLVLFKP